MTTSSPGVEPPTNDKPSTRPLARSGVPPSFTLGFFEKIQELTEQRAEEALLDLIYDRLDDLLVAGDFDSCDAILAAVEVARLDPVGMVGFLTITLPARERLPSRAALVTRAREALSQRRPQNEVDALLRGLE